MGYSLELKITRRKAGEHYVDIYHEPRSRSENIGNRPGARPSAVNWCKRTTARGEVG